MYVNFVNKWLLGSCCLLVSDYEEIKLPCTLYMYLTIHLSITVSDLYILFPLLALVWTDGLSDHFGSDLSIVLNVGLVVNFHILNFSLTTSTWLISIKLCKKCHLMDDFRVNGQY